MNAIDFLIKEHNKVRKAFAEITNELDFETKRKQFTVLAQDLIRHETMEQQIWYPHFRDRIPNILKHLLIEEKSVEEAINNLQLFKTQDIWQENFSRLKTDVEHHATEEEIKLFPEVKKFLSDLELEKIGLKMNEFKENLSLRLLG